MKLQINITKEILESSKNCGSFNTGQNCAIGKAIFNLFGNKSWVGTHSIMLYSKSAEVGVPCIYIDLPKNAIDFITLFDQFTPEERIQIKPFSFEIEVPDEIISDITNNSLEEFNRILEQTPSLQLV